MKILVLFLLLLANTVFAQNNAYQEAIKNGDMALKNEEYEKAISKYKAADALGFQEEREGKFNVKYALARLSHYQILAHPEGYATVSF